MARFLINGTVYFTESSTLIAQIKDDDVEDFQRTNTTTCLYQTRGGAFWFYTHGSKDVWHEKDNAWMYDKQISECHPTSPEMARDWFKRNDGLSGFEQFRTFPEEFEGSPMKAISFRMPAALKQEIDAAAETEGISVNSWLMRCAERGVRDAKAQYSHQPSTNRDQREATRATIQATMTNKFSDMG